MTITTKGEKFTLEKDLVAFVGTNRYATKTDLHFYWMSQTGRNAGIYIEDPFGETHRFGPNLEEGDVKAAIESTLNILATQYQALKKSDPKELKSQEREKLERLEGMFEPTTES